MHTNNSYKNHYKNIFAVINQINKYKAKIYDHCIYPLIIIKRTHNYIKNFHPTNIKNIFRENIMFFENDDKSCTVIDLYLNSRIFLGYEDSYNYYDIDIDKILLFKKSDNEYIIRYNDVNRMKVVPLQLKIFNFYNELNTFANNNRVIFIYNDDKEFFRKCREIWNKIAELIGINDPRDFVETDLDYDHDEFITVDVCKNTSFIVEGNYRNKLVIVLHSVFNGYLQKSSVLHR